MEVSNADRVVFPADGITKGEVVAYYARVSGVLLPYLKGRALTIERFPKGIGGEGFMQKNTPTHYPDNIGRHETPKEGGGTTVYPVVEDAESIPYLANQGVITFHTPPVKVGDTLRPDWIIWDLDPLVDGLDKVRGAAAALRGVLEEFGIDTLPMTSGSKGYHLRARVKPDLDGDIVAGIARGIAALGAMRHSDLLTVEFYKKKRGARVFVDWLRNAPYATAVAPWSLRSRDGAPVAAPLSWGDVAEVAPDGVKMGDVAARLESYPWEGATVHSLAPVSDAVAAALDEAGIVLEPFDRFRA